MRFRAVFLVFVLLFCLGAQAHATVELNVSMFGGGDFQGTKKGYTFPAPSEANYYYYQVRLTNRTAKPAVVHLEGSYSNQQKFVIKNIRLAGNAWKILHVPINFRLFYFRVSENGKWSDPSGTSSDESAFLNLAPLTDWATEKQKEDFRAQYGSELAQLELDLPDNWLCYVPFRVIFISSRFYDSLSGEQLAPLLTWVRAGGSLTVYGTEPRPQTPLMLGKMNYQSQAPWQASGAALPQKTEMSTWEKFFVTSSIGYSIHKTGAQTGGIILATLFGLLAGPINYFYFTQRKQIRALLISLPVISVVFCLMIVVYFLATQGFARKGAIFSASVVDEKTSEGFAFSANILNSGLYPRGGFHFGRDTLLVPAREEADGNISLDLTRDTHVVSGLFQPSIDFLYFTVTPFQTRERIVFENDTAANGFRTPIESLYIRRGGKTYKAIGPISSGKKVRLTAAQGSLTEELAKRPAQNEEKVLLDNMDTIYKPLLNGSEDIYLAFLKSPLHSVDTGVSFRDRRGANLLIGLIAPQGLEAAQ